MTETFWHRGGDGQEGANSSLTLISFLTGRYSLRSAEVRMCPLAP